MRIILAFLRLVLLLLLLSCSVYAQDYNIGVYYFPGWTVSPGMWWSPPWERIKPYPEREPLLGYYPEGETWVAEKHIEWMHKYGVDFIIYDWYWNKDKKPHLEHALKAYLKASNKDLIRFTILWSNHTDVPENLEQFETMVDYWIKNYFNQRQYLCVDGKPVVYIFSPYNLRNNASKFGKTVRELLELARAMASRAGLKGIYFVACTQADYYWVTDHIPKSGYDAVSGYNYHRGYNGKYEEGGLSKNFGELAAGYKQSWSWIIKNSRLPYFVPVTTGCSGKPWGSRTPHDESVSDPKSFRKHLQEAKDLVDKYPNKTKKTVVVCCWNEFGEGVYIEPTKLWQFQYLQGIKDIFAE